MGKRNRSPIIAARFCSSSTPPASADSPRSTRDWKSSTRNIRNRDWRFSAFPAISLAIRSRAPTRRFASFCELNYGVTFPLFSKIDVNGDAAHPLYKYLKTEAGGLLGDAIKWNFTKFLVSREGKVLEPLRLDSPARSGWRRHCQSTEGVGCRRPVRRRLSERCGPLLHSRPNFLSVLYFKRFQYHRRTVSISVLSAPMSAFASAKFA